MPLELNGKPFTITDESILRRYSKEMVFTVAKQYIKRNNEPDMRRIETAPIHVPTYYNHFQMENGLRKSLGILRYYEALNNYTDNGRTTTVYTPEYIGIGHTGVMKSTDPELNYFLDNSPWNERVKSDSLHPNYIATAEPLLGTYNREKLAGDSLSVQKKTAAIINMLLDESVYPTDRLRALAQVVKEQAGSRKMATKLWDSEVMPDEPLRTELIRVANAYPLSMDEIINFQRTDLTEEILKWRNMRVIEFTHEQEWLFHETQKNTSSILKVPNNVDPVAALAHFLRNNDSQNKWYKSIAERYKFVNQKLSKKEKETTE